MDKAILESGIGTAMTDSGDERSAGTNGNNSRSATNRQLALFWRIAVVLVSVTLIWLFVVYVGRTFFGPGYDRLGHVVSAVLTSVLVVPVVVLARRFLDQRPWAGLRLPSLRRGWRSLLLGMGCYVIPATIGLVMVLVLGWVEITVDTSFGEVVPLLLSLMGLVFLSEALPEELVFRGYIYHNLNTALPRWAAVGGQAVLFALWGVAIGAAPTIDRVVFLFGMALILGMIRAITDDVWACIGFHLAFQTTQQFLAPHWSGDQFIVSSPQMLEGVAFGLVPFVLAVLTLEILVQKNTDWRETHPDES
ncbi:CPBP family intramembrane glutamic endopeptidase [Halococcus salifodinae]|uniref:Caax amino protease n=1 Tax=Halococcus salifodinae DSM 8989 TaxID=1227456 RepID=M0MR25_9EURY|nr:type II CAAX endopeptidase family protein [Halococcus salifodinae]EMA48056.1 caax amino protease [Halococcus salifodinae DSM 8989]